jgi:hypothetical protein
MATMKIRDRKLINGSSENAEVAGAAVEPMLLQSRDGDLELRFVLQRNSGGMYVERDQLPLRGIRVLQSLQFADAESFYRWCDDDPVRFRLPLLYLAVKRSGAEFWRRFEGGDSGNARGFADAKHADRGP